MNTALAARVCGIALSCMVAGYAQAAPSEASDGSARLVATVLKTNSSPSQMSRQMERDCSALAKKDIDGPAVACEAVRCATGVSPAWSMCPAAGPHGADQDAH